MIGTSTARIVVVRIENEYKIVVDCIEVRQDFVTDVMRVG